MAAEWTPDIVVGVDFGMTCTGVAYSYAPHWPTPKPIQHWPGLVGSQIATKVPSHIRYHNKTTPKWGFQCDEPAPDGKDIKQYFKLNLDPEFIDSRPNAPSRDDAMRYFRDYIGCVYTYVVEYFGRTLPRFEGMKVEFVFSVPTTWKDPRMVEELRNGIGFEGRGGEHRAVIGLTEAEAAAVYVSGLHYQKNDVILVCDAGGGTTDVNVLKLTSAPGEPTVYHPLGFVEGKPVGSVFIDLGVHQLICAKLESIRMALPGTTDEIAWQMMAGRFERFKCSFGVEGEEVPTLRLDLPPSAVDSHAPEYGIVNGQLLISRDEIRTIFDSKITDLFDLLDEQIRRLQLTHPAEKISFLVLSGGFGSCPYVRARLTARYETATHLIPEGIKVLTVDEPQLAVVQGQVMNRTQQLKSHAPVFNHLYSPVSYGVICDWMYDPKKHVGEMTRFDDRNQTTYAINQIDWLVLKGDLLPRTGLSKSFPRKISPRDLSKPFLAQIVMSQSPRENLPQSMRRGDAKLLCELEVDTASVEKKPKNHRWYHRAPVYFLVTVVVKLVIEPAGLQFELWDRGGGLIGARSTSASASTFGSGSGSASASHMSMSMAGSVSSFGTGSASASPSGSPITIRWESIAEKMPDDIDSGRRLSVPLQGLQRQRDTVASEMGADFRFELPGDMGQQTQQTQKGRDRNVRSYHV
ncbi:hypothetical protein BJX76DRAFT_366446 [Aspergillus varians]